MLVCYSPQKWLHSLGAHDPQQVRSTGSARGRYLVAIGKLTRIEFRGAPDCAPGTSTRDVYILTQLCCCMA
jgi:hypothetical protein